MKCVPAKISIGNNDLLRNSFFPEELKYQISKISKNKNEGYDVSP